ncbi:hypothetical protein E2C01_097768 [Portunus trituberculatus]|uniref:Uncharacterized protein n=1 Tax=Portunus trituberculatus TaxID=210409 RepID=A0A5B7JW22_PORTR|nr:hypothetical protein [Portunus trituberculatus]
MKQHAHTVSDSVSHSHQASHTLSRRRRYPPSPHPQLDRRDDQSSRTSDYRFPCWSTNQQTTLEIDQAVTRSSEIDRLRRAINTTQRPLFSRYWNNIVIDTFAKRQILRYNTSTGVTVRHVAVAHASAPPRGIPCYRFLFQCKMILSTRLLLIDYS